MNKGNLFQDPINKVEKTPTGIEGFDFLSRGGLPTDRATLVCGGPGSGKTVFGMEFLVHGARVYDDPGLFVSFEVGVEHLLEDFATMQVDLEGLIAANKLKIIHIDLDQVTIIESGEFTLDPLFIQLNREIDQVGAKRVVLDSMEKLYGVLSDSTTLRREVIRLFDWLREKEVTTIVTGEQGHSDSLTHYGFEVYASDCVILLDHRIDQQISKRRLRIIKFRGSLHGEDEYPFVIAEKGISVFPITSAILDHQASTERISSGIKQLDDLLGGGGYYKGSTVLVTGQAGTGKSTFSIAFAKAACERGERILFLAFEESPKQIIRNMHTVGFNLQPFVDNGCLKIVAFRPSLRGLEEHLIQIHELVKEFDPKCVVMDPITSLIDIGSRIEVKSLLTRIMDFLRERTITLLITVLSPGCESPVETDIGISSLMDTWVALDYAKKGDSLQRIIYIVKSRGMGHSFKKQRMLISAEGISIEVVDE